MRVVAFNGSPRPEGNTGILLKTVLKEIEEAGIQTQLVQIGQEVLSGCIACGGCAKRKDRRCANQKDPMNDYIAKMDEADGILIGSPTYFSDVSVPVKALIERSGYVSRANGFMFKHKPGAAVVAVRRAGATHVMNSINYLFLISQMLVVGSSYWPLAIGRNEGEVFKDEEGMTTMKDLGRNMAWLLGKLGRH